MLSRRLRIEDFLIKLHIVCLSQHTQLVIYLDTRIY